MLPTPPHCATSRPPGRSDGGEVPEQRVVVGHPVEGRGRQDRVDRFDRERLAEIGDDVRDPVAEASEALARCLDHRRRSVEGDHPAARQATCEQLRHAAAAAAGVEHPFVAGQREAIEDRLAPARHRVGDAVVRAGIPVARHPDQLPSPAAFEPRSPKYDTAPPTPSRAAETSMAWWNASTDAWRTAASCASVASARGGLSGGNAWRMSEEFVSSPVSEPSTE